MKKVIFIDRDGTLIYEPVETKQVNSLAELTFLPMVISSLKKLSDAGYELVIVTNQDGLGTPVNSRDNYEFINKKIFEVFNNEGVKFSEYFECPHYLNENCECRKPKIGMVKDYLNNTQIDLNRSYMVGDRVTDIQFAENIGIKGFLLDDNTNWVSVTSEILNKSRTASISRKTKETDINIELNLDGSGQYNIYTGLKFFDHMLEQLSKHGGFDLKIKCDGDLAIDEHHTIEDVAIALGEGFKIALGNKHGIERYSWERILVMDEAKTEISLDFSGRSIFIFNAVFDREFVGDFPTEMLEHFFHSFCLSSGLNLHIKIEGSNTHHKVECCFKSFARCLKDAVRITGTGVSSTKGIL